ncbi:MAG: DEAD/DEAH box helicase [Candidatus Vogelbacteria bacterium]
MHQQSFRPRSSGSSRYRQGGPNSTRGRFGPRPSHSQHRGSFRGGGRRPAFSAGRRQHLDISAFINKAVVVEETEQHFLPEHSFASFAIDERLKKNIISKGYSVPTPIQDRAIPHILQGKDVVGIANTGTGKTAAFLIPIINKVLKNPREPVLIVVPTRELAIQINQEFIAFASHLRLFSVCCVGGTNISPQIRELRHPNHFIIGTPGRLKDLINRQVLKLGTTTTVILDEADRMLDMGFIPDMRFIMAKLPTMRQTLFFSATLSAEVKGIIHDFLREPVHISVTTRATADNIDQDIVRLKAGQEKVGALHDLLIRPDFQKVLIFGRTKYGVEKLAVALVKRGFKADSIHGNKSQGQRQRSLGLFKEGRIQVLVATDVAARGLDIANVSHVINYDLPATYEDYVHRIGRTGRGTASGSALTFVE